MNGSIVPADAMSQVRPTGTSTAGTRANGEAVRSIRRTRESRCRFMYSPAILPLPNNSLILPSAMAAEVMEVSIGAARIPTGRQTPNADTTQGSVRH